MRCVGKRWTTVDFLPTQDELDKVAAEANGRPRNTLSWPNWARSLTILGSRWVATEWVWGLSSLE
jgi:hypothetical protein